MYPLFVILIVIAAILMIGIVLIQESKGGGLSTGFAGGNAVLGVRKTTDFIENVAPVAQTEESVIEKAATEQSATNPNNLPGFGASQKEAPAQQQAPAK